MTFRIGTKLLPFSIGKFFYKSSKIRPFHWWIFQWTKRNHGFFLIFSKNLPIENGISSRQTQIFSKFFCFFLDWSWKENNNKTITDFFSCFIGDQIHRGKIKVHQNWQFSFKNVSLQKVFPPKKETFKSAAYWKNIAIPLRVFLHGKFLFGNQNTWIKGNFKTYFVNLINCWFSLKYWYIFFSLKKLAIGDK